MTQGRYALIKSGRVLASCKTEAHHHVSVKYTTLALAAANSEDPTIDGTTIKDLVLEGFINYKLPTLVKLLGKNK